MLAKFKVKEHKKLNDDKGYIIDLETPFGQRLGTWISASDKQLLTKYAVDTIHVLDVYAYKDKDQTARLGVKLEHDVQDEAF